MKTIPVTYIDTIEYVVKIHNDEMAESPAEWGNFTITEMSDDMLTENGKLLPSLQTKLRNGTAFLVDKYEHGNVLFTVHDEDSTGDHWDTSSNWGIIEFSPEYIKGTNFTQRRMYAQGDLATYTEWANGEVYWVEITTKSGLEVDSVGGLYGDESIKAFVQETIPDAQQVEYIGVNPDGSTYDTIF